MGSQPIGVVYVENSVDCVSPRKKERLLEIHDSSVNDSNVDGDDNYKNYSTATTTAAFATITTNATVTTNNNNDRKNK